VSTPSDFHSSAHNVISYADVLKNCVTSHLVQLCYWYMLTYDIYGAVLFWVRSNTILTHNQGATEVCSSIDSCSWCNGSCHHLCDSEFKWVVWNHPTVVTRKKRLSDVKGWDPPLMSNRQNCTCECHSLPRTWSLHTGLQLSTWNWRTILQLKEQYIQSGVRFLFMLLRICSYSTWIEWWKTCKWMQVMSMTGVKHQNIKR